MRDVNISKALEKHKEFLQNLQKQSGQNPSQCFQCMKCTGGCPFQFTMDYSPSQIVRMLQNGLIDEVLESYTIWTCATCATCSTRCPRDIDIARMMDALRVIAYQKGISGKGKNMRVFHTEFMNSVKKYGRIYEVGLAMGINLGTRKFMQDTELGLPMFIKGKISVLPHKIQGRDEISRLYDYARKIGE